MIADPGTSFVFEINNVPIFCGGANWIPDDNFLPRVTPERYRDRLEMARDGNMNMIRVWGGGIYEDDVFYQTCDEFGLLVWQDFMFGCGIYPAHPDMLDSVKLEAEQNVTRLRNYACLAIWTGNNEDYQIALSRGLYDHTQALRTHYNFPLESSTNACCRSPLEARSEPTLQTWQSLGRSRPGRSNRWRPARLEHLGPYRAAVPALQNRRRSVCLRIRHGRRTMHENLAQMVVTRRPQPILSSFEFHIKADDGARRLNAYLTDLMPMPAISRGTFTARNSINPRLLVSRTAFGAGNSVLEAIKL